MLCRFMSLAFTADTPLWASIPFGGLLLAIALFPLFASHFWEKRYAWVATFFALPTLLMYLFLFERPNAFTHVAHEYTSFIALIGSLFIVTGGILIHIHRQATPALNVSLLLLGALLANLIGTTGASVLLIRPYLRINRGRVKPFHVVFFIFLVSNIGGALTPIGDPPLYLGYLKGVPFFWTLEHLFWPWVCTVCILLTVFFILDSRRGPGEVSPPPGMKGENRAFEIRGGMNFLLLAGILTCVFLQKFETYFPWPFPQLGMLFFAMLSLRFSPKGVHQDNEFSFHPIREVAVLFAAIFITMVPALEYLEGHAQELGLQTAGQFFWATGALSAFLDNAPTYLAFLSSAMGLHNMALDGGMEAFLPVGSALLVAISCAAVFFGAFTYIGNGPNFLVKSIAEKSLVPCPSFLGYIFRFSIPVLLPLFVLIWLLFF